MPIVTILIVIMIAALVLYVIDAYVPDYRLKRIIQLVVVVLVLVWLIGSIGGVSLPRADFD